MKQLQVNRVWKLFIVQTCAERKKVPFCGRLLIWADLAQNLCLERWIGSDCRHHGRALLLADDSYAEVEVHHGPCHHADVNVVNITMVNVNMVNVTMVNVNMVNVTMVNVNIMVGPFCGGEGPSLRGLLMKRTMILTECTRCLMD